MAASMKALIAYDGSACAEAALDDLKRAGLPGEVEAMIVTVTELGLPPPSVTFKPVLTAATEPLPAPVEAARNLAIEASRTRPDDFRFSAVPVDPGTDRPARSQRARLDAKAGRSGGGRVALLRPHGNDGDHRRRSETGVVGRSRRLGRR